MSCAGTESVHVSNNVARTKTGYLRRYNKGILCSKWRQEYFVLYVDSTLAWFEDQGKYQPIGAVLLKDICEYMAVGVAVQYIKDVPRLCAGAQLTNLIAIPVTRSKHGEFVWILCVDQNELKSWLQAITAVLPPPPQPHPQQPPQPPSGAPPPYGHGTHSNLPIDCGHPPQTVVVQDSRSSSGADLATGMIIGGAFGYSTGHPWGGGWGFGGYGFGSGVCINNHYDVNTTTIEYNNFTSHSYVDGDFGGGEDFSGADFSGGGDFGEGESSIYVGCKRACHLCLHDPYQERPPA